MHVSAPSLSTFPQELVLEIYGYLKDPQDRLNLVCCSRRFQKIFLPLLYRNLQSGGELLRPIAQLVSTLATKPALAACVQTLHLSPWETYLGYNSVVEEALPLWKERHRINGEDEQDEYSEDSDDSDDSEDDSIYLKTLDFGPLHDHAKRVTSNEDEAAFWMREMKKGNADAWIGLLLTLLPGLRRLEAEFPHGSIWPHTVLGWAATGRLGSTPAFSALSEVYVDWESEETSVCAKHLMPFLLVPSLRKIHARGLQGGSWYGFDAISRTKEIRGTSHVTHIELEECDGDVELSQLIGACEVLRSFKYSHRSCEGFDPRSLHEILLPVQRTIETVWIDIHHACPEHEDQHLCDDTLPSFRDFTALKTLHLRLRNLSVIAPSSEEGLSRTSFAHTFPYSIETLQVVDTADLGDLRMFAQKLQNHVDHDLDQTPALTRIDFKPSDSSPERSKLLENMASACKKGNLEFHICDMSEDPRIWGAAGFTPRL
ncbi:hypothetical protein BJX96DRAFT_182229 [Aspergillus floccosus]